MKKEYFELTIQDIYGRCDCWEYNTLQEAKEEAFGFYKSQKRKYLKNDLTAMYITSYFYNEDTEELENSDNSYIDYLDEIPLLWKLENLKDETEIIISDIEADLEICDLSDSSIEHLKHDLDFEKTNFSDLEIAIEKQVEFMGK